MGVIDRKAVLGCAAPSAPAMAIGTKSPMPTRMPRDLLDRLYRGVLRIRIVEETIAEHYREQQMRCPVHLCIGQEAIAVGVCEHLARRDYVMSGHRSHGHYLAKGGCLRAMVAELYGKQSGCTGGVGGSMHLVDLDAGFLGAVPIVASTIPIAVGAAFGVQMRGEDRVVVTFFGEGATEEGVFHESLDFAALHQLPIVFVCENNLYSVYSPLSVRQATGRAAHRLAEAHGVASFQGDGNDALEVHEIAGHAIRRARSGLGSSLVEFSTYRWREHCGPHYDNQIGYRTEAEFQRWKKLCPVARLEARLAGDWGYGDSDFAAIRNKLAAETAESIALAKSAPMPDPDRRFDHVYADKE